MKIIQLNMWNGALENPLLRFMEQQQPDILCLQELEYTTQVPSLLDALTEKTGMIHHHVSPLLGYEKAGIRVDWSNCIMSKFPFQETHTQFVHKDYNPSWRGDEDFNHRNFQHVRIQHDDIDLNVVNYHGYHVKGTKLGNDVTTAINQKISDYIQGLDGSSILTGDFNLAPDSPSLSVFHGVMRNLCVESDIKTTRNFIAKRPDEVIDYIFVSNDITVKNFHVPDDVISDHQALILEI